MAIDGSGLFPEDCFSNMSSEHGLSTGVISNMAMADVYTGCLLRSCGQSQKVWRHFPNRCGHPRFGLWSRLVHREWLKKSITASDLNAIWGIDLEKQVARSSGRSLYQPIGRISIPALTHSA